MCFQAHSIKRGKSTIFLSCFVHHAVKDMDEMAGALAAFTFMGDEYQPPKMAKYLEST